VSPTAPSDCPFARVAIVGVGLIGGSIALAARRRWPRITIAGVDHPPVLTTACDRGVIDETRFSVRDLRDADLIVLAAPIHEIIESLGAIGRAGLKAAVTDTGSTKRHIVEAASRAGVRGFVGGHPMAGKERGGIDQASGDLFAGRPWLLVSSEAPAETCTKIAAFVRGLGAEPHEIDPDTHDRTMAYVSHLPQIVSTALMARVGDAVGDTGLARAGRGLADMTRLAASPSDVWQGILATNADYIAEAAEALAADLRDIRGELTDEAAVAGRFERAHRWRSRLPKSDPA
jgi:prephenate dehydrogenase